jgi:Ca-activated chloride channel family protein
LLVIGGENSYGPGGYRHSVLEDVLPVSCDVRDGRERPTLALMLVIDKSGSMQENDKIGSARVAALAAAKSLGPNDQIGIIVFEDEARRLSPLDRAPTQQARLPNLLQGIIPGGGTHIRPALELAVEDLRAVGAAARHKHIILLTDGQDNLTVSSKKPDYMRLCEDALGSGIRISTVAVGSEKETDRDLLREIANRGQGKFYFTEDATEIPRIVLKAANEVGRRSIKEGFFDAQPTRAIPEFRNLRLESAPQLEGYVMTRLAPGAEEALHTPDGDPLLAWRNFGLGKCTAFTSDARNRWARQWIDDPSLFNLFWAQVCRRTARSPEPLGVEVQVMRERRKATVILDNVDLDGRFVNGSKIDLLWGDWDPARGQTTVESVTMNQVAPGRYQASFPLQRGAGEYFLQLRGRSGDVESLRLSRGLVVGFDEELRLRPTNTRLLRDLSETTGGCYDPSPEEVFEQPNRLGRKRISLVPYFLGFAVLLLVVDVSVRRLPAKS